MSILQAVKEALATGDVFETSASLRRHAADMERHAKDLRDCDMADQADALEGLAIATKAKADVLEAKSGGAK